MSGTLLSIRRYIATKLVKFASLVDHDTAAGAESPIRFFDNDNERLSELIVQVGRTVGILRDEVLASLYDPTTQRVATPNPERADRTSERGFFENYLNASRVRTLYASDIFPEIERVWMPVGALHEETSHVNQADLLYVAAIAKVRNCKTMFEFGTYQGRTTYHLTLASDEPRVVTLNLPPSQDPSVAPFLGVYFKGSDRERFIEQVFSDSRTFKSAKYRGMFDFVFVDGDHSYDMVKNDTEKAFEMLKPGGIIVWHDYAPKSPGVVRYIHDLSQERPMFRIKNTCLIVYIDGLDVFDYTPPPRRGSWLQSAHS